MPNIDRRTLVTALLFVASAAISQRSGAQQTPSPSGGGGSAAAVDSLPFRAGQWGADFAINDGAVGLGVLRFRSPRMAWSLNTTIDASWSHYDYTTVPTACRRRTAMGTRSLSRCGRGRAGIVR